MKKITALILVSVMICLAFVSCATTITNTDSSKSSKTEKTGEENTSITTNDSTNTDDIDESDSDLAYIQSKGSLVIGITEYKPMNYRDDSGNWTGFDTEFAEAVCAKLGVKADFIVIDWERKFEEIKSKAIDCIWNGMTITDEVILNADVTKAYVKNAQVVIMPTDKIGDFGKIDTMKDLTFACEAGSAGEAAIKDLGYNLVSVTAQSDALLEVSSGSADACVIDITMANAMTGEGTSYASLGIADELESEEYGIAFRHGSDLVAKVNSLIDELISDGTLDALAEKYELTLVK